MIADKIYIKGAREHNLKNVDLELPRNKLIVMTGLSGSGKSSLAFDTIYAEGQRRYVESLSSYARQFLGQMEKPDVDYIEGLSPAISIDQKTTSRNPRSTVGTVTEIHDYLRLMYARVGTPHCPNCGKEIQQQTIDQIVDRVLALPERTKIMVLAPVIRGRKGEYVKLLEDMQKQGYVRARIDGEMAELDDPPKMAKTKKRTVIMSLHELDLAERVSDRVLCVKGAYAGRFGTPEEVFTPGYMSELYDITEGTFDEASGRAELPRVTGKPEVFVIAGGGNGAPVYRRLQREKIPFSTGILWKNDIDYPVACVLAAKVIAEEAFETVAAQTLAAAKREIDQCGRVLCLFSDFGVFNQADRELLEYAKSLGKSVEGELPWQK